MKLRYILFGVLLTSLLAGAVFANIKSWPDPFGYSVNAQTWIWKSGIDYFGNARTWRGSTANVYKIWVRGEFWNDCDYYHRIYNRLVEGYYTDYVEVGTVVVGSDQCAQNMTFVEVKGEEHFVQFTYSVTVGGKTYEKKLTN